VFLTSLSDSSEINRGKESGADDYLVKPFNPQELLAVVRGKVLRSRGLRNLSDERYDSYRRKVIHTLSHEFRTPLVAINTGTELLIDQGNVLDTTKIGNLLKAIQRGGQRLEHLVNDFMLLQQIEAGIAMRMFSGRAQVRTVTRVLQDLNDLQQAKMDAEGFVLQITDRSNGAAVKFYEPQIENILERLINNAIKFSPSNRTVEICAATQADEVVIEVRDRGIGLNPEKMKEAVDVFGQLDRERLEQQGGGLGLAIASRYAAIHGGRLDFERRSEGGSIVSLILPRANTASKS
jgi:signal transduction histidine kinase